MISSPPGCKSQCKICSLKRARNEGGSGEVWATCRGWWPSRGPEICLSWPVIDSLLGSLKAQEVAGIISVYMWHQFVQIYIESPSALKVDYFTLLLLLFKFFFFFFLETCKSPPKNWISWSVLSFDANFKNLSQTF